MKKFLERDPIQINFLFLTIFLRSLHTKEGSKTVNEGGRDWRGGESTVQHFSRDENRAQGANREEEYRRLIKGAENARAKRGDCERDEGVRDSRT